MMGSMRPQQPVSYPAPALSIAQANPLSTALASWQADMDRRGVGERGSGMFVKRVRVAAAACGWSSPADMRYDQAAEYLAATRKERGWAGNTTDGVVSALRCFSRFCHAAGLVGMDPFLQLNRSGEQGGPGDRALTVAEVRSLITVAAATTARDRRSKCPRGLYYGFLALTGLRTIEAEKCTWGDVDLDAEIPSIWSDPSWSKNGQRQRVCLCPEIVEKLREWRRCVPNGRKDLVFPQVPNRATWIKDRVAAEIPEVDARGRRAGMHGLRKAFATWLYETGASDATISRLLRHGATLAQKTYVDPAPTLEVEAVNRLPKIFDGVQVSVYAGLTPTMPKNENKAACVNAEKPIRSISDPVSRTAHPAENNPPVRQTNGVASRGSPPGGLFSVDGEPARESSAARRESRSSGSRDQNRPRLQPSNGYSRAENDAVLIFAEAVARLGRMLERRHGTGSDTGDDDQGD
jgi:integrase